MGRKSYSTLTPGRLQALASHVEAGQTYETACHLTGTSYRTFAYWMRAGRDAREALEEGSKTEAQLTQHQRVSLQLLQAIELADGRAASRNVDIVLSAAQTNWNAAAWWLERRKPQDYGRRVVFEDTQEGVDKLPPLQVTIERMIARTVGKAEVIDAETREALPETVDNDRRAD